MNLSKIFDLQKELDAPYSDIPDRLSKDILWLMEELGELAREWRGHKYRRPERERQARKEVPLACEACFGRGFEIYGEVYGQKTRVCKVCSGSGVFGKTNPLLEEYTDCLSIILSIGLQDPSSCVYDYEYQPCMYNTILNHFIYINWHVLNWCVSKSVYELNLEIVIRDFLGLGKSLGFTWEQIESNYIAKVEANKQRNKGV